MNPKKLPSEAIVQANFGRKMPLRGRGQPGLLSVVAVEPTRQSAANLASPVPHNPHFERIGGAPAIRQLVDAFYRNMEELPEAQSIRAMHPSDLGRPKETLFKYLVGWMGGPQRYAAEHGQPRLRQKHAAFAIGDTERDAWMQCMRSALDTVVMDKALRREIAQAFQKTATFLRNR